jgi:predicted metal-dependent peptidase
MQLYVKNIHDKLLESIKNMIIVQRYALPYYGEFNLHVNFHKSDSLPTCGVNISSRGFNFYYNSEFLDGMSQKEVNFVVLHEDFHLLFNHPRRTIVGQFDPKLANIAQDMIINHIIWEDINHDFVDIPKNKEGENIALFIPKEYTGKYIFEELYHWLRDQNDEWKSMKDSGQDTSGKFGKGYGEYGKDPQGKGKGTIETPSMDSIFDNMENNNGCWLDTHLGDEVPEEYRDQIVKDIMDKLKSRGLSSGDVEKTIGKLRKKRKDYLSEIKRSISSEIMGYIKDKTIVRPNRRGIPGMKGNRKIKSKINVILDTSGSMSSEFDKVMSYIYRNDIEINLIQCDTEVKSVSTIKNRFKLDKIKIRGLGGTVLNPAIVHVAENFNNYNLCILTDGATDRLDFSKISGKVLIISSGTKCPIAKSNGKVKQIVIEKTS